ncbi:MAG: 16S rRNA (guanine(527)-N(7))-methyltransferase RsmG [Balneolales bacterium]|nr:16S rRNA (guanine(527)-N(7))-methyltransferase RsmG [Balneolales bacterium]
MSKAKVIRQNVSRETFDKVASIYEANRDRFKFYADKLIWWNKKVNLISRNATTSDLINHIKHSLYIASFINSDIEEIVDAGTGGGLPGIPLAIINPERRFVLVDVVQKKILAIDAIKRDLGLKNTRCVHRSIGDHTPGTRSILVSKHAFKLGDLIELTKSWKYDYMVLLKGSDYVDELENIDESFEITSYDISAVEKDSFFAGKYVLVIKRV